MAVPHLGKPSLSPHSRRVNLRLGMCCFLDQRCFPRELSTLLDWIPMAHLIQPDAITIFQIRLTILPRRNRNYL